MHRNTYEIHAHADGHATKPAKFGRKKKMLKLKQNLRTSRKTEMSTGFFGARTVRLKAEN